MKQFIYIISSLILLSSCSTLDSIDRLVSTVNPIYNIKPNGNSGYLVSLPIMSNTRRIEITKYIKSNYILRDSNKVDELKSFSKLSIENRIGDKKNLMKLMDNDSFVVKSDKSGIDGSIYVYSIKVMSNSRKAELIHYLKEIYTDAVLFSDAQIKSFISMLSLNNYGDMNYLNNITKPDSASIIQISFDDRSIDMNSKLEYIYFWNYSNFRFLVPLLPFFNEKHKRNQCVNRAIEACFKNKMDGVLIYPTLNHFKLYKNQ